MMPTPTEVEARLRRAADACEPLVDALLDHDPTVPTLPVAPARRRRPRALPWVAAAAAVALVVGGLVAVAARDTAPDEVASAAGGTVPAPPGAGFLLPDGSRVELSIPGATAWEPGDATVLVDLDGLPDPRDVRFVAGDIDTLVAGGAVVEQDLGDGRAVVVEGNLTSVAVAHDGWVGRMLVSTSYGGDEDLPADAIATLAQGLDFSVSPEGPLSVVGPGVWVRSATRGLVDPDDPERMMAVRRNGGRPVEGCEHSAPPWACRADDTVLVEVPLPDGDGEEAVAAAEAFAAEVEVVSVTGEVVADPMAAQTIVLPNRSQVDISLPAARGWEVTSLTAAATLDGATDVVVDMVPAPGRPDVAPAVVDPDGLARVAGVMGGWEVSIPLADESGDLVPRDRWAALASSLRLLDSTGDGGDPVDFQVVADGLEVRDAAAALESTGPDGVDGILMIWVMRGSDPACAPTDTRRCFFDGAVVAEGRGEAGREDLHELVVGTLGRSDDE